MEDKYIRTAERLKALAEPTRLKILKMLALEEMCVCEIISKLHLSQPAISHHLKILRHAHIISDRKVGKWIFYSLNKKSCKDLFETMRAGLLVNENFKEKQEPLYCQKV